MEDINPLNAELNPICHMLALLGGATIVVVSRLRVKFVASQARSIYQYKSIRTKILKCNAEIFFNRQCLAKNVSPNEFIKDCL
jgi:hypothetical protein